MRNNLGKIFIIVLAVLVVVALVFSSKGASSLSITQKYLVPNTFNDVAPYGQNTIVFSNGRSFAKYNFISGQVSQISPDNLLPELNNIDSLSASANDQYLLFHDEASVSGTPLYNTLVQQGLNVNQDWWWIYNVSTKTFSVIPHTVLLAKIDGNQVDTLVSTNNGEEIVSYSVSSLAQDSSIPIINGSNFFRAANGFLLQTTDNEAFLTSTGVVNNLLSKSIIVDGVSADGQSAYGVINSGGSSRLVKINLQNSSIKTLASNVEGQAEVLLPNLLLYNTAGSGQTGPLAFNTYNLASSKKQLWGFSYSVSGGNSISFTPTALLGETATIAQDSSSKVYLIGNGLAPIKSVPANYKSTINVSGNSVNVSYSSVQTTFEAVLNSGQATAEQAAVYTQLNHDGYNPLFYNVQFSTTSQ